jgi:retron-type reverse transcriptase
MRLYSNLFENATSLESILEAWDEFKIGKRKKPDVQKFEYHLSDNLFTLHDELANRTYRHGPYYEFRINDPKPRIIHKAIVRDRVVHHLIYKSLAPLFEKGFIADSFSCRIGKGTHRAVNRLKIFLDKVYKTNKTCFVLKCDVRKFFQSIDHEILLQIIGRKIRDRKMMELVSSVIGSFSAPSLSLSRERERGWVPDWQSYFATVRECVYE